MAQGKRKLADRVPRSERPKKRIRKQKGYHSSSDEEDNEPGFTPVNLNDSGDDNDDERGSKVSKAQKHDIKTRPKAKSAVHNLESSSEDEAAEQSLSEPESDDENDDNEGDDDGRNGRKKSKRNDPDAFSTSMSKILSTKLSQSTRTDPVLARSKEAAQTSSERAHERLEHKAKAKIKADKKEDLDRGRNKDVLGIQRGIAGEVAEEETKLRKIATRGVIQLFNAFHAAHVRAEQAAKEERQKGTIGVDSREERIKEKSKQGFLELIGGKKKETA